MPSYDMQAWSLADFGSPASFDVGDSFTVGAGASADIVTVTDGGTDDTPDDFNPVDSDQLVSGTVDGTTYTNALHQYEIGYQVTDGTNTFVLIWVNTGANQQGNNQNVTSDGYFVVMEDPSNPGQGGIVPGTTYTIVDKDISVNYSNGNGFDTDPLYSDFFVCFARGTRIDTADGERPIETIREGDFVRTRDDGLQPVRWIGHRRVSGKGSLAPISIAKGTLGNTRALLVSPQHRILIRGWRAELFFGQPEVLVAAKHLADGDRICAHPCRDVEYWHMLFDRHQIVLAEGIETESFYPGDGSLLALDRAAQEELFAIFPELRSGVTGYGPVARACVTGAEAKTLTT